MHQDDRRACLRGHPGNRGIKSHRRHVIHNARACGQSRLRHSADSRLGRTARENPVWVLHGEGAGTTAWAATGARLFPLPLAGAHIDLTAAFRTLAAEGLTRVMVEAGGTFAAALIRAGLVDELALFQAGCLIGEEGRAVLGPLGLAALSDAPRPRLIEATTCGSDTLTRWAF